MLPCSLVNSLNRKDRLLKRMHSMRKLGLGAIGNRLLSTHVTTRAKGMGWRVSIHVKSSFTSKPQRDTGTNRSIHSTFMIFSIKFFSSPVMIAMYTATVSICLRLFLIYIFLCHIVKCCCVVPCRALRSCCINLLS